MIATKWNDFVEIAAHNWLAGLAIVLTHIALLALFVLMLLIRIDCVRIAIDNTRWFIRGVREWVSKIKRNR